MPVQISPTDYIVRYSLSEYRRETCCPLSDRWYVPLHVSMITYTSTPPRFVERFIFRSSAVPRRHFHAMVQAQVLNPTPPHRIAWISETSSHIAAVFQMVYLQSKRRMMKYSEIFSWNYWNYQIDSTVAISTTKTLKNDCTFYNLLSSRSSSYQ